MSHHAGSAGSFTVPDAHLLFSGDYHRSGQDLIISDHDHRVVVPSYFGSDKRPALVSPEGAQLDSKVVDALTGYIQYAQAGGAPAAKLIGHVAKLTGSASVVRNGVTVEVQNGDAVYQSDVVQTGSSSTLGLVLIDGTTFNLSANARLMLNDLTYDATSTSNSSLITLVQGAASFVAGQVAKTGDMKVASPVATMGIRGTAVILDISATDGSVSISVIDQHDNQTHTVQVYNTRGDLIGTVTSSGGLLTLTPTATFDVIAQQSGKTPAQIAQEIGTLQVLLNIYELQKAINPNLPQHTDNSGDNANPQTRHPLGSTPLNPIETAIPASLIKAPTITNTNNGNTIKFEVTPGGDVIGVNGFKPPSDAPSPPPPAQPQQQTQQTPTTPPATPFVVNPPTVTKISTGSGDHFGPVMSADGQFVTYDPDGVIYLFDRKTGGTITISPADGGFYTAPTISSDGRFVVYQGADGYVFLYDNDPSSAHYKQTAQIGLGTSPVISGDGSTIVVAHEGNIVAYDRQGSVLATITPADAGAAKALLKPSISADGHVIAFWGADSTNTDGSGHLYVYDQSTGTIRAIADTAQHVGASAASISADGHYVVYQSADASGHTEIYLYDLQTNQVLFHTANASGGSYNPVISPDGHFIIFASDSKLSSYDTNSVADTYVVDVTDPAHPIFKLVSALADGTSGNAASNLGATISAGGLYIAFGSRASNFSTGDGPGGDIFIVDPTSGRSAVINETASSPATLAASGTIPLTGDHTGTTITVSGDHSERLTASFDANGNIVWTFAAAKGDFASLAYGQDFSQQFVITLNFGAGTTTIPVTVTVHNAIQPVITVTNAPPVIHDATLVVSEGDAVVLTAAAIHVTDLNDSAFTFNVSNVSHGAFELLGAQGWAETSSFTSADLAAGQVRFVHDGGEDAPTFSIQADDGRAANHLGNVASGTVNFSTVNDAPVITAAALTVSEGGSVPITAANIGVTDPDSSTFTFTVSNVSHGTFQLAADGQHWTDASSFTSADLNAGHVRFVHDGGEHAPTFSIQADDGAAVNNLSDVVTGSVEFTNINDPPTAAPVTLANGTEDSIYIIHGSDLLAGAADVDSTSLSVTALSVASGGGTVVDNQDGTFTYTPAPNYAGPVSFIYTVSDGDLTATSTASLTLNYEPAIAPTLVVGSGKTFAPTDGAALSTQLSLHAGDVISLQWNFTTDDYLPFHDFAFASVNGAAFLLSDIESTGSYGSTGWHTFSYTVTADGTYTIGAGVMNDKDTLVMSYLALDNLRVNGTVVQSFETGLAGSMAFGNVQVVASAHSNVNPTPILPTDGNREAFLTSQPVSEFQLESFLGLAQGSLAHLGQAEGAEHSPIVVPIGVTVAGHPDETYVTISGAPEGSVFNHGVYDNQSHTWRIDAADLGGNLTITTPIGYSGTFSLTVTATSAFNGNHTSATSAPQTQIVTVDDVAPVAAPVTLSDGTEDTLYTIHPSDLLAGVTDIGGTPLSITALSVANGGGTLAHNADGSWSYTPAQDYNGPVSFNYTASDGTLTSNSTASLNLAAVNDAPSIAAETVASGLVSITPAAQNHVSAPVASELASPGLISGFPGESGFGTLALDAGDDNSSGAINITSVFGASGVNFFGHNYSSLYINNNGNITFNAPIGDYTPSRIDAGTDNPIIAAFWADVDTSGAGAVYYDLDPVNGIMTITWDHVGYYFSHNDKLNTFQIVLISEGNGNFDIEYRYDAIRWTTGDASGGFNGLNGTHGIPARAGYSAGDDVHYFELPQSGNQSALLSLPSTNGNTGIVGVDHFEVRNGEVGPTTLTSTGTINFSDPDLGDIHSIQSVTYTGSDNHLGTLTLVKNADTTDTGTGGKFTWTYTADPAAVRTVLDGLSTHSKVETFDVVIGDGHGGTVMQSVAVTLTETGSQTPVINVDNLHLARHDDGTTTFSGLSVTDSDATSGEIFSVSATTAGAASGTSVTPASGSGHLADINATLATGVTYHKGDAPPSTDMVTVNVADGHGAADTVNMIFSNAAAQGVPLTFTGTTGKDVLFATGHQDQFVFAANFNHDTIMGFTQGQDHIDLSAVVTANDASSWFSQHVAASPINSADTLVTVDAADTIVLHGVSVASLSANDFILHPGGSGLF